jgi:hypothetical protein
VSFIFACLTPNFLGTFSYPYNWPMPKFNSIFLVNIPEQFFKVPVWGKPLWRRYILDMSKWDETLPHFSYDQIMPLHQILAHVTHPCEPSFKSWILVRFLVCEATIFYIASFKLKIYQDISTSISTPSTNFWLNSLIQLPCAIFPKFCPERCFMKQVLFWQVQVAWNFVGIFISSYHWAMPNSSSSGYFMWVLLQGWHFWPVSSFELQVSSTLLHLSWNLATMVILVSDLAMPKLSIIHQLCRPSIRQTPCCTWVDLLAAITSSSTVFVSSSIGPLLWMTCPADMVGQARTRRLH